VQVLLYSVILYYVAPYVFGAPPRGTTTAVSGAKS